jgi:agmatine deiminase
VDDITRFVSPDTVVTAVESDPDDPNYEPLRDNIRRLRAATDQDGKALAIIELPMPGPVVFVRMPSARQLRQFLYRQRNRAGAGLQRSQRPFRAGYPGRPISRSRSRGIYSGDLIWAFGAMHCMTQQEPAV